jgi:hypothetical protein
MYRLQRLMLPNPRYRWLSARIESSRLLRRLFTAAEKKVKEEVFGCRMCGQCALPSTGYACPMSCPKELRNGPCGGVGTDGSCEVYPDRRCVWLVAYERALSQGRAGDLCRLQRPIDHRRWGESSWLSYWQGRDEGLWTDDDGLAAPPPLQRDGPPGGRPPGIPPHQGTAASAAAVQADESPQAASQPAAVGGGAAAGTGAS